MARNEIVHGRIQKYAYTDCETLFQDFHITNRGLSDEEVESSRSQYGSNVLSGRAADTVFYRLRRAFINPFTVILFVLASISFLTDVLLASNFSRDFTTPFIILIMLVLSGTVRFIQEMRAKRIADHLTKMVSTKVIVLRNGEWKKLPSGEIVVGDRIRIIPGCRVPADIRLTETNHLFLSQSVLTGESSVLRKDAFTLSSGGPVSYRDYSNIAFMGSAVISGSGEGIVLAVGADTVYGGFSPPDPLREGRFEQGAYSIAWVLIRFMSTLVPVVFLACGFTKGDWFAAFLFSLSVAVGLTPEMLPMVINACLAKGGAAMEKKETIVKNINAMQGFGSMDILCVDKTGTLTGDRISLEYYMDVLGNESQKVLDLAYLNSFFHTGGRNHLDTAILNYREAPGYREHFQNLESGFQKLDEIPFDHEQKYAGVLIKNRDDSLMVIKGGIDEICRRCSNLEYKGSRLPVTDDKNASIHAVVDEMLEDGMKVIAVAYKEINSPPSDLKEVNDFTLVGYLAFFDAPKQSAAPAIQKLRSQHLDVRVLTGDQREVALSICKRLGFQTNQVITGEELEGFTENELPVKIEETRIFAQLSPRQKVEILHTLQGNGHTVGFLGDGMNDLPAIVESDVGISVDNAAEAVKEAADVILLKKDLNVLEAGIKEGRKAFCNVSKYIKITASSNFGNIFAIVIASIFLPFLPMTAVQLLLLNLLYDVLCLVLPWDNVEEESSALPLEWSGKTLGRFMRFFGPISSLFDLLTFVYLFYFLCPSVCGGGYGALSDMGTKVQFIALFQTGWFLESIWTQVLILHLLRTLKIPFLQSRASLPVMVVTFSGTLLFTFLALTPAGNLIGLTALPAQYFVFLFVTVFLYLFLVSLAKRWYIRKYRELL